MPADVKADVGSGTGHGGHPHPGPGKVRAAPAVGMLKPCGQPLVDVARLGFNEDPAGRRQQFGAAVQQPGGLAADADVAVRQQHRRPPAVPWQRIEH